MKGPRTGVGAELVPLVLILACVAGSLALIVSAHRRQAPRRPRPPAVAIAFAPAPASRRPKPAAVPGPPPVTAEAPEPEVEPPPPPVVQDPTPRALAKLTSAEADELLETSRADRKAAALDEARKAALAESERWRRRQSLIHAQLGSLDGKVRKLENQVDELALERDALEKERDARKAAASHARSRPGQAILPHKGPNGTWRRPIVVECRNGMAILQPKGVEFGLSDLESGFGPSSNPFVAAIAREAIRVQGKATPDGEPAIPYIFFVVRPDGIRPYYEARGRLEPLGITFGYELADQEWEVDFPDLDDVSTWDGSAPKSAPADPLAARPSGRPGPDSAAEDAEFPAWTTPRRGDGPTAAGSGPGGEFAWPSKPRFLAADAPKPGGGRGAGPGGRRRGAESIITTPKLEGIDEGLAAGPPPGYPSDLLPGGQAGGGDKGGPGDAPSGALGHPPGGTGRAAAGGLSPFPSNPGRPAGRGLGAAGAGAGLGDATPDRPGGGRIATSGGTDAAPDRSASGMGSGPDRPTAGRPGGGKSPGAGGDDGRPTGPAGGLVDDLAVGTPSDGPPADLALEGPSTGSGGEDRPTSTAGKPEADPGIAFVWPARQAGGPKGRDGDRPADPSGIGPDPSLPSLPGNRPDASTGAEDLADPASSKGDDSPRTGGASGSKPDGSGNTGSGGGQSARRMIGRANAPGSPPSGATPPPGAAGLGLEMPPAGMTPSASAPPSRAARARASTPAMPELPRGTIVDRTFEVVAVCGPRGVIIQPGGYRVTSDALRDRAGLFKKQIVGLVKARRAADPKVTVEPRVRFLIQPGGFATYRAARGQFLVSGLDWPSTSQVADPDPLAILPSEGW